MKTPALRLGIDIGSTTVKLVVIEAESGRVLYSRYQRHHAHQAETARLLLEAAKQAFPEERFRTGVCGSGGKPIAQALDACYIQEVVANAAAVQTLYPQARTAVELGGQDAKVIFFRYDEALGRLTTSDMRMNGSCAGGTGAFLDEIAALLDVEPQEFETLAAQGTHVYEISGRCGVFAKTDIQPLLIQGAARADIALSTFHAVAKQTIGGLSQGLELTPPIIFEGGPLTFHPTLIRIFAERLNLKEEDIIRPEHPETIVARGTALAIDQLFPGEERGTMTLAEAEERLRHAAASREESAPGRKFFASAGDEAAFTARHRAELMQPADGLSAPVLRAYIGIDSGSTTTKFVVINEDEQVTDTYYDHNNGEPLRVARQGLTALAEKYRAAGVRLEILGVGTTGYGEQMMARAVQADYHTVETVAHAEGCRKFVPDATFLLDIGGQDMKAIWLRDGVVTNIVLNEACSSGCGSLLENFAASLGIPVREIAAAAFRSRTPAVLGSRCTVFMNSTIINEQRNGKQADDLMAGLCRSIIENVFTKVVRIANVSELGDRIVVQGGTFRNLAVLRALEEYLGREVTLSPYPGEMGALGAALAAKRHIGQYGYANGRCSSFIGFEAVERLTWTRESGVACGLCANHCSRTITRFSTGGSFVTGNRCDRGAIVADSREELLSRARAAAKALESVPDLFKLRQKLLFEDYPCRPAAPERKEIIGLPRVLEFWDSMPFWSTFFQALGFETRFSRPSSRGQYESGLQYVASDTICFPAKLVHGHIRDLAEQGVDRIFLPFIMHMPTENQGEKSPYVCPVIMGYPMVVRNFQSPEEHFPIQFETPVFHWFREADRKRQICAYAADRCGVTLQQAENAYAQAQSAIRAFRRRMREAGAAAIRHAEEAGKFAVVLAGRPYHTDPLISHSLSEMFTRKGIPVLTVDSLPNLEQANLRQSRVEITNDFHARMLAGALEAAAVPALEYVQIVSFGCGHDAILSDEIVRILSEGGKPPLVLKLDESEASGSLGIRVQSFIETVQLRRSLQQPGSPPEFHMPEPYPVKYRKRDRKLRVVLVPNISAPVSTLLTALMQREGLQARTLPVGGPEEIALGKKYTHNDICFPCQMVVGELIAGLRRGGYPQGQVAVGMAKLQCDCRMANYSAILRKALDSAGYADVPILTTDPGDTKGMHPGVSMLGARSVIEAAWSFVMLDILEELCRRIRPYERHSGETNRVFDQCVCAIAEASKSGLSREIGAFRQSIEAFRRIPYDRSVRKPRVLVTGELLVTYHPGTNFHLEEYLERSGMETVFPRITYQFRKDFLAAISEIRDFKARLAPYPFALERVMAFIQRTLEKIALSHPLYRAAAEPQALYEEVREIIPQTLTCGEGWLMAGEIVHYAKEGVRSFIILQPFGCLPNHVCGRGVTKRIKELFPSVQILPLDLDPDTSYANVENRLQMLIMNGSAPEREQSPESGAAARRVSPPGGAPAHAAG